MISTTRCNTKCLGAAKPVLLSSVVMYGALFAMNKIMGSFSQRKQTQCVEDLLGFQLSGICVSIISSFVLRAKKVSDENRLLGSGTLGCTAGIICNIVQEILAGKNRCGLDCFGGVITGNGLICS